MKFLPLKWGLFLLGVGVVVQISCFFFATEDHMCHHGGCYRKIGMKLMVGCLASSGHQRGISQPANVCCLESEVVVFFMPRDQQQQIH